MISFSKNYHKNGFFQGSPNIINAVLITNQITTHNTTPNQLIDIQKQELLELKNALQLHKRNIAKKQQQKQQQLRKLLQQQVSAEQKQLSGTQDQLTQQEYSKEQEYIGIIQTAISAQWIKPETFDNNNQGTILINVKPSGEVISVQITKTSGSAILDRSAQTAAFKASPLPMPKEPELINKFLTIELNINPQGIANTKTTM